MDYVIISLLIVIAIGIFVVKKSLETIDKKSKESFAATAFETLKAQTEMGGKELESERKLIVQTLEPISKEIRNFQELMRNIEKDRKQDFGYFASVTPTLQQTLDQLRTALANRQVRGQWGERMAEDVLRLAGFIEGINYQKQKESADGRPDFTFFLPQGLKVNMDVKFPLDNYLHYIESDDAEKESHKSLFLKDVRKRIKEVTTKDYINPEEKTVDYVIVFIPNEQVYGFINEHDRTILDEALKKKVILCSPLTLYAILAVIRKAIDNFKLEQTSAKVLSLLDTFSKQWNSFVECMEKMGKKIEETQEEYNSLISTRRNKLEKPLREIEDLHQQKTLPD